MKLLVSTLIKYSFLIITFCCLPNLSFAQQESTAEQKAVKEKNTSKDADDNFQPYPISLKKQQKEDLKHYLPATKVKPILVGTDDYLTLVNENTSANHKGVAMLIPDWRQGAVNPKAINYLRKTLPNHGWTTISVQVNPKPSNYPSTALKVAEQIEENKKTIDDYKMSFAALINAVYEKAKEYPGIVIIIAQGNHGALLVDLLAENENITPNGIVLLSSYRLSNAELLGQVNTDFAKTLANSEPPILDLYLKYDNDIVINKAPQRLAIAKQEMKIYYRQRRLNNMSAGFYPEKELLTQINSWLKAIGW